MQNTVLYIYCFKCFPENTRDLHIPYCKARNILRYSRTIVLHVLRNSIYSEHILLDENIFLMTLAMVIYL